MLQSNAVQEDLDDGREESVDSRAHSHGRLSRDGRHGLADEVGQRYDGKETCDEQEGRRGDKHVQMQDPHQHEPIEDDQPDYGHEVDQKDVCAVDGILPVLEPHGSVGADEDR